MHHTLSEIKLDPDFRSELLLKKPTLGHAYLLVKIHKGEGLVTAVLSLGYPGRLICPMTNHPCIHLSKWVHRMLSSGMSTRYLPEYLRDSSDFLRLIDGIRVNGSPPGIDAQCVPFTVDVDNMYPSIDWEKGGRGLCRDLEAGQRVSIPRSPSHGCDYV